MEADWDEVARIAFPPPGVHALPTPVSVLAFDAIQELLWSGNEYGRVTSFYGSDLQRYTSFRAHSSGEGPVRQLLFNDKGVLSIAARSVHMSQRRGLARWNINHANMEELRCMSYTSRGTSEILVAGLQDTMFTIDVERGVVTKEIPTQNHYTLMKHSRYICAATSTGSVDILDARTFEVIKSWKAHAAAINDMDAQNNFLVTCGFSPRQQHALMLDPLANVFDLRNLTPLPPIPFHAGAAYVRMHPRMSTTGIVASRSGQMQVVDLMNPNTVNLRQAAVSSYLTHLELAPSGEALALGDGDCAIHLWGSPSKLHFAELSNPVEFADAPSAPTPIDWTSETPLNSVGLPYYRELLLSSWPSHLSFDVGTPPTKIDPAVFKSITPTEFGGYAPNPRTSRRNQVENSRASERDNSLPKAPKFLSEKAREPRRDLQNERRTSDAAESLATVAQNGGLKTEIPVMYRNVEIKYSRFGVDDFDFEFYNKTDYSGLETHIANSYSNPLLQLYRFTPLLRNLALNHAATNCLSETCLLCEMGYLFNMLELASGQNCQATNFLKTFSSMPQASALGLLEDDSPKESLTALTAMVQVLNRFLLERISSDHKQLLPHSQLLDQALAMAAITSIRCVKCLSETVRPGGTFVNELVYAIKLPPKGQTRAPQPSFSQLLKASIEREHQTRGWCDKCRRYQSLATRKTIQGVPDVLMLNAAVSSSEAARYWATKGWLPEEIGVIVESGQFFCFEGAELRARVNQGLPNMKVYQLIGVVADIVSGQNQASHLVSLIDVSLSSRTPQSKRNWHLFNDFLVKKVSEEEALRFNPGWKLPSILAYQVKTASNAVDDSWKDRLDTALLYHEYSYNQRPPARECRLLSPAEAPGQGTMVAIDAEFVALQQEEIEINADGSRETIRPSRLGLARVSVLRGSGIDEGMPFIDDYIATKEQVVDYLTAFSGIRMGDLDPRRSPYNVVPLKVAYKKLWLLLNLGCVFVGHGLPKDFRTINMHVPKNQVVDTVDLFFIPARQRKLSLRFLAWILLRAEIQQVTHDSIEDARTALRLYRKYQEFVDAGVFEDILADVYSQGRSLNYKAPTTAAPADAPSPSTTMSVAAGTGADTQSAPTTPIRKAGGMNAASSVWTPGRGTYFGNGTPQ